MRWSETVEDYYPVDPQPRWGFSEPVSPVIKQVLERSRTVFEANLRLVEAHRAALYAVPLEPGADGSGPAWNNVWFSCLDGASLVTFLLSRRPRRYIEIGSGHSTRFARHAITWGRLDTMITSIDPQPRSDIDRLCDTTIRMPLEKCDLAVFDGLEPGDILFFDGSHRVFTNSDVAVLFLEVLPRLRPGVLVHLHDIFLPADYPPVWSGRLYSEQYLLAAMLICGGPPFRVIMPNYFVCTDAALSALARSVFNGRPGSPIPFYYSNGAGVPGVSFWVETV